MTEPTVEFRVATDPKEIAEHHRIRREVFVDEQGLFDGTDRDDRDDDPRTGHLVAVVDGAVVGSVRIYPLDETGETWLGDRLAVGRDFRILAVGAGLVRCAVATAGSLGGTVMHAHIQVANVNFFRRLGWSESGEVETYVGTPHQPMSIPLR